MTAVAASDATGPSEVLAADGTPLKLSLRRAIRRSRIRAALLVAPVFLFILITFLAPIASMIFRSVENPEVATYMARTAAALEQWDGTGLPGERAYAALYEDLKAGYESRDIGKVATRLNYEISGMRSTVMRSARRTSRITEGPYKEALISVDDDWADPEVWQIIKRESDPYTLGYYLNALDLTYNAAGEIVSQPENRQIYVQLFIRTLWMSGLITFLTLLLGYPVAYLLANLPLRISNLLMILVLLPFWTSLLVRTTTWIAMLQSQGVLNDLLVWANLIGNDSRLQMIHNKIGTIVAMTHILLPFMILPLYSVMKTIDLSYVRAALSMGATPWTTFWRVYFPQTTSGIGAGGILVFILSIGYYITPALVGGTSGRFITNFIAYHMQVSLNWGLAAAIGAILLGVVLALYMIYARIVGVEGIKLG